MTSEYLKIYIPCDKMGNTHKTLTESGLLIVIFLETIWVVVFVARWTSHIFLEDSFYFKEWLTEKLVIQFWAFGRYFLENEWSEPDCSSKQLTVSVDR